MSLKQKDLVSIADLSTDEISLILDTAEKIKQDPASVSSVLSGKIMASCFFEPSTRTRLSFEAAMQRCGGSVIGFSEARNTSSAKGETLSDSIKVISPYVDAIVLRHPKEGSARLAAEYSQKAIINAGDGSNRHPTQTLLDLFTIRECQDKLDSLHVALIGDLKYGRTCHSLVEALARFGARLYFVSPESLAMPQTICDKLKLAGAKFSFHRDLSEIVDRVDILYMTRIQKERFGGGEVQGDLSGCMLNAEKLKNAKPSMRVMHPLPRVDEISTDVDKTDHAYYFQQAENGLYVRQAILKLLLGA